MDKQLICLRHSKHILQYSVEEFILFYALVLLPCCSLHL